MTNAEFTPTTHPTHLPIIIQRIIERIGVNSNSFNKFMNPGTYKNMWSATENGTYWAGAKLLAELEHEKEQAKLNAKIEAINDKYEAKIAKINAKFEAKTATVSTKRDVIDLTNDSTSNKKAKTNVGEDDSSTAPRKKTSTELKEEAEELIQRIKATYIGDYYVVYDSCPEIVTKIKTFLEIPGMTKAMLCSALGNINNNSLGQFLSGKKQDQCGNITYRAAFVFFEKLRILEGKSKSMKRLTNEAVNLNGVRIIAYCSYLTPALRFLPIPFHHYRIHLFTFHLSVFSSQGTTTTDIRKKIPLVDWFASIVVYQRFRARCSNECFTETLHALT